MEKYLTVCGIGNGGGIIADSIYQQYAVSDENAWQNSGIDIMAIGNAWDLKELSVINKVKGKATQVSLLSYYRVHSLLGWRYRACAFTLLYRNGKATKKPCAGVLYFALCR